MQNHNIAQNKLQPKHDEHKEWICTQYMHNIGDVDQYMSIGCSK
jgi:hypothetical protein